MTKKSLKSKRIKISVLICVVFILVSVCSWITIEKCDRGGSYSSGSLVSSSSGLTIDIVGRFGEEENLSERVITENEGESLRPLFRYSRILMTAVCIFLLLVSVFETLSSMPIQTTSCSHFFTINYLHNIDGCK